MSKLIKSMVFVSAVVLTSGIPVLAQKQATNPIDKTLASCLKVSKGTMRRAECYSKALEAWQDDVTKTYAELRLALSADARPLLEESQRNWEKYRDSEFDLLGNLYGKRRGTGYISARIMMRIDIVRNRALLLEERLSPYKAGTD